MPATNQSTKHCWTMKICRYVTDVGTARCSSSSKSPSGWIELYLHYCWVSRTRQCSTFSFLQSFTNLTLTILPRAPLWSPKNILGYLLWKKVNAGQSLHCTVSYKHVPVYLGSYPGLSSINLQQGSSRGLSSIHMFHVSVVWCPVIVSFFRLLTTTQDVYEQTWFFIEYHHHQLVVWTLTASSLPQARRLDRTFGLLLAALLIWG